MVKNHDSTGKELESVGDERAGENEGCEEKKSCTAAAEKFAFHPFQRWRGPFIRSANQFESARSATLALLHGKSMKRRGNPLQSSSHPVSLTGPFLSRFVLITFHPLVCPFSLSRLFPPFCVKNEVMNEGMKKNKRWIFRGKEGFFLSFSPFEKFAPITFIPRL